MSTRFDLETYDEQPFEFEDEEEFRSSRFKPSAMRGSASGSRVSAFRGAGRGGMVKKRPRPRIKFPFRFPGGVFPVSVWHGLPGEPAKEPTAQAPGKDSAPSGTPSQPPESDQGREGSEYVRWAQTSLNNVLNLNLRTDGVMDDATRDAIRSFQRREKLPVTGALGPDTQQALIAATRITPGQANQADEEIPWLSSIFPALAPIQIEDRTAFGLKENRKGKPRDMSKVYALVLHQTAFSRGNDTRKYDRIPVHFVITPNGKIIQLHPLSAYLWSSNGFNAGSVAVEFVGNFPNTKGKCWQAQKFGCHRLTQEQINAGRSLIRHLIKTMGLTHVLAHRQSSGQRENDPGPDVWYHVGQWAVENHGMKDGGPGFKVGSGKPIPDVWRNWGQLAASQPTRSTGNEWEEGIFGELAAESNFNSVNYIRWVQQSLNKILGLRLAVDGVNGPQTRSAVRSFQQRYGLVVDGIVGPKTDAAIKQALGGAPARPTVPYPATASCEVLDRFDFDKDQLKPFHQPQLENVAARVVASQRTRHPVRKIQIAGHTDVVGDDPYNLGLGQRRANQARKGLIAAIEKIKPGASHSIVITAASKGESNPVSNDDARNRRVEICLETSTIKPPKPKPPQPKPPQPKPPQPKPPQPKPPQPKPPACVPPVDIKAMILVVNNLLRSLPLGMIGVKLPTAARCLTPAEQSFAMGVYAGSLDFTKILIADGLGAMGRPFTVAVPTSVGWHVVMLLGNISRSWVGSGTLIHELAHAWQSQHHGSDPTAFMKNSVECQARALADIPIAKAAASAAAVAAAVKRGVINPVTLSRIGAAAAAAEDSSAYAYIPGKAFGDYAAEQIAQQVEDSFTGIGSPTPGILSVIRSVSANTPSRDNQASLSVISFHRKSTTGVVFH